VKLVPCDFDAEQFSRSIEQSKFTILLVGDRQNSQFQAAGKKY